MLDSHEPDPIGGRLSANVAAEQHSGVFVQVQRSREGRGDQREQRQGNKTKHGTPGVKAGRPMQVVG